jgi:hypothetical protein
MPEPISKPHVLAMIVCDQVIIDIHTGKQSIIGSFAVINAAGFPVNYPQMAVYVALTEGRGPTPLVLRLVDVDEGEQPIVERKLNIQFRDPRQICELHSLFQNLVFRAPGEHRFQLLCEGELLMERRLLVRQVEPRRRTPPPAPPPDQGPP